MQICDWVTLNFNAGSRDRHASRVDAVDINSSRQVAGG